MAALFLEFCLLNFFVFQDRGIAAVLQSFERGLNGGRVVETVQEFLFRDFMPVPIMEGEFINNIGGKLCRRKGRVINQVKGGIVKGQYRLVCQPDHSSGTDEW